MKKSPFNIFFAIIVISVVFSVFVNDVKDRIDFILTGTEPAPYPQPYWPPARITTPGMTLGMAKVPNDSQPVGSDYVQVYLSAKALTLGQSAYAPTDYALQDPFQRLPNYPPLVNWAYIPFSRLYYPVGLALHNLLTMSLFFGLSLLILLQTGFFRFSWKILIIYLLLYMYTPLGYSHYEKGQFDFYVAAASLLPAVIFMGSSGLPYFFTSGILGAFKWSSLPFLGAFSAFAFFASGPKKRWYFVIPLGIIVLSVLLFWPQFLQYLPSLRAYEINFDRPVGLSFWFLMPKALAKSFQILCLLLFSGLFLYFSKKETRQKLLEAVSLPFALAMAAQGLCFGTFSLEYRVVTLLGMVVPLLLWLEKTQVSEKIKLSVSISFGAFLVVVFRNFEYLLHPSSARMTLLFLLASLFWLGIGVYLIYLDRFHPSVSAIPADAGKLELTHA